RWVFDLGRFSDAVARSDAPALAFELSVGFVPVTVVRLQRTLEITDLRAASRLVDDFGVVDLTFEEGRHLADRVARLWPLTRPWDGPLQELIPDGQRGHISISGYDRLHAGEYLAEVTVDGGWTTPVRPMVGAPGTRLIRVGEADDL